MPTSDLDPDDETAVRALLAAAAHPDPQVLTQGPPALTVIGIRARRLRRVRRARQTAVAAAAIMVVAVAAAALPYRHPATKPATVPAWTTTYVTPSESMEPTLHQGDSLLVDTTVRTAQQLRRGDIIVFKDPGGWLAPAPSGQPASASGPSASWLVKRVIGLPGDTVTCCDGTGRLTVNGVVLVESYVAAGSSPSQQRFTVTVRPGRLWVMGDNRDSSWDSRFHRDLDDGQVPQDDVVGRVTGVVRPGSTSTAPPGAPASADVPGASGTRRRR